MSPIRVLPENLVNKIAAGEVIVRPASVVKELVENSIDACATRIRVEVENGCRDIRIIDDGEGMDRADAALALVRHATSKIENFDDLYGLGTRGFRGEALASIASVSRLELLTRRRGAVAGTRVRSEGGMGEPRVEPAGAPEGTDIRARDLFFNTPARLKFLKSPGAELQAILQIVVRQALIRPDLGFAVAQNGSEVLFDLPPAQAWNERVGALLGGNSREHLLEIEEERNGVRLRGFVARPAANRKDRRQQHFYVHGRPISSRALSFALQEAYKGVIMVGRFPVCVIDIELAPGEVDINVHPTKEEVRFRNESGVAGAIMRVAEARLRAANLIPTADLGSARSDALKEGDGLGEVAAAAGLFQSQAAHAPAGVAAGGRISLAHPGHLQSELLGVWTPPESRSAGGSDLPPRVFGESASSTAGRIATFDHYTANVRAPEAANLAAVADALPRSLRALAEASRELEESVRAESAPRNGSAESFTGAPASDCSVRPLSHSLRNIREEMESPQNGAAASPADGSPWTVLMRGGALPEPMGQVARCYIIARAGDDLLLVDQHAAHERLLYLKFSQAAARRNGSEVSQQPLLIPVSVDVPAAAMGYLTRLLPVFAELGFNVEHFGGNTFLVQSLPADLASRIDPAGVLADLLDDFEALGRIESLEVLRDRVITRMACRAAIKAGQSLHLHEMAALIRDLAAARLGFTCPHGRPTMILLTRDQLDRQFKRVV